MTDFLVSSSSSNTSIGASSATALTMSPKTVASITSVPAASKAAITADQTSCVVCGKVARANSVYCSDACIRKHAHGVVSETSTAAQPARSTAGIKQQHQQTTIVDGIKKLDGAGAKAAADKSGPVSFARG